MMETAILSLIFLDVGLLAVLLGKAAKQFQPLKQITEKIDEEETFLSGEILINDPQINPMNEPTNRAANHTDQPEQSKPEQLSPDSGIWLWEFKIVRGSINGFRGFEALKYVCEQEKQAGWILFEKLDNQRLRFRRPIGARKLDHLCRQDPYRTYYGMPPELSSLISLLVVLALLGIPTYWGFGFIRKQLSTFEPKLLDVTPNPTQRLPAQPAKK